MTDPRDEPPAEGFLMPRREFVGDVPAAPDPEDRSSPIAVAGKFYDALLDHTNCLVTLQDVVPPELLDDWGDFSTGAEFVRGIPDGGLAHYAEYAAPGVAYIGVLSGIREEMVAAGGETPVEAIITLVWRPDQDSWLVLSIGSRVPPELIPPGP